MEYKITFKKSVLKDLQQIDIKKAKNILHKIETVLSQNAHKYTSLKGKFNKLRKYRVGEYRIIYSIINDDTVMILRIAHRKEVYRKN